METLISSLPNIHLREKIRDDDFVDQLHHYVTVYLLVIGGILVGIKEFAGAPIDCFYAQEKFQHFQGHANTYCWSNKLYRFPNPSDMKEVPYDLGDHNLTALASNEDLGEINFYRWITIIFVLQAFLFKLPNLIWTECNEYSGTQIEKMVSMIAEVNFEDKAKKMSVFGSVAEYMETWLIINRKPFWFMKSRVGQKTKEILQHCMLCVGPNSGNMLSSVYLAVKGLFLVNVLMQFAILTAFLEFNYWRYGPWALNAYSDPDNSRQDREHFPRVALCHFQVRGEGEWLQCLLTINMLLEKLFLIEWFWLLTLLVLTSFNFAGWLMRILYTGQSVKFVTKYLTILSRDGSPPKSGHCDASHFVTDYLGSDGVFLLRILATNTNDVAMAELIAQIWHRYCTYQSRRVVPEASVVAEDKDSCCVEKGGGSDKGEKAGDCGVELETLMPKATVVVAADEGCGDVNQEKTCV